MQTNANLHADLSIIEATAIQISESAYAVRGGAVVTALCSAHESAFSALLLLTQTAKTKPKALIAQGTRITAFPRLYSLCHQVFSVHNFSSLCFS